jgi:hypothetical protein
VDGSYVTTLTIMIEMQAVADIGIRNAQLLHQVVQALTQAQTQLSI